MPQEAYNYDYWAQAVPKKKYSDARELNYRRTSQKTREQMKRFMLEDSDSFSSSVSSSKIQELEDMAVYSEKRTRRVESFNYDMARKENYNERLKNKPEAINLDETEEAIEAKKQARKEASLRILQNIKRVFLFAAAACIALFICYRYSIINEKFNSVEKAKKELLNAQTINEQLQAEIDRDTDISYIENYAKYQLGMQKPQDSQIMYINVSKQDKIFTPLVVEEDAGNQGWFSQVAEKIANIF
jgi:cell division protein FtsL